jgi:uncharacterized iron-regulated membrane protein
MPKILYFRTPRSPLGRAFGAVVAVLLLAAALVMGVVLAGLFLGLVLVAALVLTARVWWLRRRLRAAGPANAAPPGADRAPIDAEFHVIETPVDPAREVDR